MHLRNAVSGHRLVNQSSGSCERSLTFISSLWPARPHLLTPGLREQPPNWSDSLGAPSPTQRRHAARLICPKHHFPGSPGGELLALPDLTARHQDCPLCPALGLGTSGPACCSGPLAAAYQPSALSHTTLRSYWESGEEPPSRPPAPTRAHLSHRAGRTFFLFFLSLNPYPRMLIGF